ncbi:UNVERIFIED_CONTAM: hypothetical protein GTU68_048523, partial [Idotea baltica]|nr:hypothetical protein [Idotea baltica]
VSTHKILFINNFQDPKDRLLRRTILRYVNLGCTMTFILKSPSVAKRFPSLDHLIDAGFLTPNEKKILEHLEQQYPDPKYAVPFSWAGILAVKARKQGRIPNDHALSGILLEIAKLRSHCGDLLSYDWIVIPLVYTQVVTIAVYSFFVATLMGRQFLDPSKGYPQNTSDFVIPFFTYLQFIFYLGWLKVAETLVHPFGDDDDDFDMIYFIERNQQAGVMLVDDMHFEYPLLTQDIYWDRMFPPNSTLTKVKNEKNKEEKQKSGSATKYPDGAGGVSITIGTETNQDKHFAKQKKQREELSSNQNKCCSLLSMKVEEEKLKKPK